MCADVCDKVETSPVECVRNVCGSLLKVDIFSDSLSDFAAFPRFFLSAGSGSDILPSPPT